MAPLHTRDRSVTEVLLQQRAWVQHWIDDVKAGLIPTEASLNRALSSLEAAISKGSAA